MSHAHKSRITLKLLMGNRQGKLATGKLQTKAAVHVYSDISNLRYAKYQRALRVSTPGLYGAHTQFRIDAAQKCRSDILKYPICPRPASLFSSVSITIGYFPQLSLIRHRRFVLQKSSNSRISTCVPNNSMQRDYYIRRPNFLI